MKPLSLEGLRRLVRGGRDKQQQQQTDTHHFRRSNSFKKASLRRSTRRHEKITLPNGLVVKTSALQRKASVSSDERKDDGYSTDGGEAGGYSTSSTGLPRRVITYDEWRVAVSDEDSLKHADESLPSTLSTNKLSSLDSGVRHSLDSKKKFSIESTKRLSLDRRKTLGVDVGRQLSGYGSPPQVQDLRRDHDVSNFRRSASAESPIPPLRIKSLLSSPRVAPKHREPPTTPVRSLHNTPSRTRACQPVSAPPTPGKTHVHRVAGPLTPTHQLRASWHEREARRCAVHVPPSSPKITVESKPQGSPKPQSRWSAMFSGSFFSRSPSRKNQQQLQAQQQEEQRQQEQLEQLKQQQQFMYQNQPVCGGSPALVRQRSVHSCESPSLIRHSTGYNGHSSGPVSLGGYGVARAQGGPRPRNDTSNGGSKSIGLPPGYGSPSAIPRHLTNEPPLMVRQLAHDFGPLNRQISQESVLLTRQISHESGPLSRQVSHDAGPVGHHLSHDSRTLNCPVSLDSGPISRQSSREYSIYSRQVSHDAGLINRQPSQDSSMINRQASHEVGHFSRQYSNDSAANHYYQEPGTLPRQIMHNATAPGSPAQIQRHRSVTTTGIHSPIFRPRPMSSPPTTHSPKALQVLGEAASVVNSSQFYPGRLGSSTGFISGLPSTVATGRFPSSDRTSSRPNSQERPVPSIPPVLTHRPRTPVSIIRHAVHPGRPLSLAMSSSPPRPDLISPASITSEASSRGRKRRGPGLLVGRASWLARAASARKSARQARRAKKAAQQLQRQQRVEGDELDERAPGRVGQALTPEACQGTLNSQSLAQQFNSMVFVPPQRRRSSGSAAVRITQTLLRRFEVPEIRTAHAHLLMPLNQPVGSHMVDGRSQKAAQFVRSMLEEEDQEVGTNENVRDTASEPGGAKFSVKPYKKPKSEPSTARLSTKIKKNPDVLLKALGILVKLGKSQDKEQQHGDTVDERIITQLLLQDLSPIRNKQESKNGSAESLVESLVSSRGSSGATKPRRIRRKKSQKRHPTVPAYPSWKRTPRLRSPRGNIDSLGQSVVYG
ncbi:uncharacterized protein [Macrobrachium rosenbergii]|uniref:uncharacterized protein n=1 Tax=Macrobrachium rosenbergii TaxID=79674 RepID=UPI0034D6CF2E